MAPDGVAAARLNGAFSDPSRVLRDVAFWHIARLTRPTPGILRNIRNAVVDLARSGRLWRERSTMRAHLARLGNDPAQALLVNRLLALQASDAITVIVAVVAMLGKMRTAPAILHEDLMTPMLFMTTAPLAFVGFWWAKRPGRIGHALSRFHPWSRACLMLAFGVGAEDTLTLFGVVGAVPQALAFCAVLAPLVIVGLVFALRAGVSTSGPLWPAGALIDLTISWAGMMLARILSRTSARLALAASTLALLVALSVVFGNAGALLDEATRLSEQLRGLPQVQPWLEPAFGVFSLVVAVGVLLWIAVLLFRRARAVYFWTRDWWRWRAFRRCFQESANQAVNGAAFLGMLTRLSTPSFQLGLVHMARERGVMRNDLVSAQIVMAYVNARSAATSSAVAEVTDALIMLAEDLRGATADGPRQSEVTIPMVGR